MKARVLLWEVCKKCDGEGEIENFDCDYDAPPTRQCTWCYGERINWDGCTQAIEVAKVLFDEAMDRGDFDRVQFDEWDAVVDRIRGTALAVLP